MIPVFDAFDYFANLLPLLLGLAPLLLLLRRRGTRVAAFAFTGGYLLFLVAPRLALFHVVFWLVVAGFQVAVAATGERRHGVWVLWASLLVALLPMLAWKIWPIDFVIHFNVWGNHFVSLPSTWLETIDFMTGVIAPVGLSFAAFRAADLLIKSNLGLVPKLGPGHVLAYGLFPPLLVVGPIAGYEEVANTLDRRVGLDQRRVTEGVTQILTGLFKVFVIAYLLDWSTAIFTDFAVNPPWRLWIGLAAFTWFFYANFAGYSDIAIGSGRLLGADIRPNFDHPFLKTTPAGFWNSWHISLTRFLRANVFMPITARRPQLQYFATTVTMLLIAMWHAVGWGTFVFGIYHAASLVGHRWLEQRRPASAARWLTPVKAVSIFVWYALSLPLLQLGLDGAIDFYQALVGR